MTTIPIIINATKVRIIVFARLPVEKASSKRMIPVTTKTTNAIVPKLEEGCTANCSTDNYIALFTLPFILRLTFQ
jgi:hypothetical protein